MPRHALDACRTLCGALILGLAPLAAQAQDPATAPLPVATIASAPGIELPLEVETTGNTGAQAAEFRRFIEGLWPEARARGVSRATFDDAFRDVLPDAKIIALTKKQSEFVRPIWEYVNGAI